MMNLRERVDHESRLLPYVLSALNDESPHISGTAVNVIERLGIQYEEEHKEDLKDTIYYLPEEAHARGWTQGPTPEMIWKLVSKVCENSSHCAPESYHWGFLRYHIYGLRGESAVKAAPFLWKYHDWHGKRRRTKRDGAFDGLVTVPRELAQDGQKISWAFNTASLPLNGYYIC